LSDAKYQTCTWFKCSRYCSYNYNYLLFETCMCKCIFPLDCFVQYTMRESNAAESILKLINTCDWKQSVFVSLCLMVCKYFFLRFCRLVRIFSVSIFWLFDIWFIVNSLKYIFFADRVSVVKLYLISKVLYFAFL